MSNCQKVSNVKKSNTWTIEEVDTRFTHIDATSEVSSKFVKNAAVMSHECDKK